MAATEFVSFKTTEGCVMEIRADMIKRIHSNTPTNGVTRIFVFFPDVYIDISYMDNQRFFDEIEIPF